jgi:hypothetical protein
MLRIPMARTLAALVLLPHLLPACAPPGPGAWQKAGATDATIAADTEQCRTVAQQQAARLYPYGSSNPALGGAGMIAAQQQARTDRSSSEVQAFNDCMESRGYTRTQKPAT